MFMNEHEEFVLRVLSPRIAEQQAIAGELERDSLTHEQRMELIQTQGKSCDMESKHIVAIIVTISTTVALVTGAAIISAARKS